MINHDESHDEGDDVHDGRGGLEEECGAEVDVAGVAEGFPGVEEGAYREGGFEADRFEGEEGHFVSVSSDSWKCAYDAERLECRMW